MKARTKERTTYYVIPARGRPFSFLLLPRGAGRRAFETFMDAVTGRNRVIPYLRDLIEGARISKGGKQG